MENSEKTFKVFVLFEFCIKTKGNMFGSGYSSSSPNKVK